jgi:hypothetical protein
MLSTEKKAAQSYETMQAPTSANELMGRRLIMNRWLLLLIMLLAMAVGVESCGVGESDRAYCETSQAKRGSIKVEGSGPVAKVDVDVAGFTRVHLATIGTIYVDFGKTEGLVIEAEDNLIEYFEIEVKKGSLKIDTRKNTNLRPRKPVRFHVTMKSLEAIALSSSGDAVLPDIESKDFAIALSSSGDLEMGKLTTSYLDVSLSSSGDAEIEKLAAESIDVALSSSGDLSVGGGKVEQQNVSLSSSGDYDARDLESAAARVRLSSSGDAYVWVNEDLTATVTSSGSVYYSGNPSVRQSTSSSGRVKRMSH